MTASRSITYRDFPCRPYRQNGESLVGYLYRLMAANGHAISAGGHYKAVQQLYRGNLTQSREILQRLSDFIGDPSYQNDPFWEERLLLQSDTNPTDIGFPKLRADSPWMCPACMREASFHREYWTLPLASTCPKHGTSLSTCCGACGGLLSWGRLNSGWRCSCGHTIYDTLPLAAAKPATSRDQLLSIHGHFASNGVGAPLLERYQADAAIHELHISYYWVVSPRKVGTAWGLSLPRPRATVNNPTPPRSEQARANASTAPLSHAFVRWAYLWRIIMGPLGSHVHTPLTVLSHVVGRRPTHPTSQHAPPQGKRARTSKTIEFLYPQRVMQLPHILVYLNDQVPRPVGLSALRQLDRWWSEVVQAARAAGLLDRGGRGKRDAHAPKHRQSAAHRMRVETSVVTLLSHLLFSSCMLFSAHELQGFWSSFILPRSLPGSVRKPMHKRLAAYFMTCPLPELATWNRLIEADLAQRHREFCDALT